MMIGKWEFEGPFTQRSEILAQPGLYAVLCGADGEYELLELDESENVVTCLDNTEQYAFLEEDCPGPISAAVFYMPGLPRQKRTEILHAIEKEFRMAEQDHQPAGSC